MTYDCASKPKAEKAMPICGDCALVLEDAGYSVTPVGGHGSGTCKICLRRTLVREAEVRKEKK